MKTLFIKTKMYNISDLIKNITLILSITLLSGCSNINEETKDSPQITENIEDPQISITPEINTYCLNTCEDCLLFPVSKKNSLREDYNPGSITSEAQDAFDKLTIKAKQEGVTLNIISGFRSYETQKTTFDYWVNRELNANSKLTRAEAEEKANVYSARPGHSEHQLGTTFDVACAGCVSFGKDDGTRPDYEFLKKYANDFGFVISYPENSFELTGYKYEPWHIRYVGVEFAKEYKKTTDGKPVPIELYLTNYFDCI